MRIGMVCPYSFDVPGGVQNHVRDLTEQLRRTGHDVSVLAPAEAASPTVGAGGSRVGSFTSAGSRIVNVLPRPGSLTTVMSPPIIRQSRRESASPNPVPP